MSDLGRLFRLSVSGPKPLENFTTVALAIAIGRDDRPMKRALEAIDWTCEDANGHRALVTSKVATAEIVSIKAKTQETLWPRPGINLGFLDLVLNIRDSQQRSSAIWVEVKVDASESGDQLTTYRKHAALEPVPPAIIITLARTQVRSDVPSLKWSDIIEAIAQVPSHHFTWQSLHEFLLDERIVRPPVPTERVEPDACIDVIVDVNKSIRQLWPGTSLAWQDGALRSSLKRSFEAERTLVTSGGPLSYGLMPTDTSWEWGLVVTTRKSPYQRVTLDAQEMVRDADIGGLPQDWQRHTDRFDVLERRVPLERQSSHDEIVEWFHVGLTQLRDAKVLDRYFVGLSTKQAAAVELAQTQIGASDGRE